MKNRFILTLHLVALMLCATSCNEREFCNSYDYEEQARICFNWDESKATITPNQLQIEIVDSNNQKMEDESANDYYPLHIESGSYNAFVWNQAENITVNDRTFTADTNEDGSIKSVGELFTGETDFTLASPEEVRADAEKDNHHQWSSHPFHGDAESLIRHRDIPIIMHPVTRDLRIVFKISNGLDNMKDMTGILKGICSEKSRNGEYLNISFIKLKFVQEGEYMVATYRVLGCPPEQEQKMTLNISYKDESLDSSITLDVNKDLINFNDDFGGEPAVIEHEIDIKKDETNYTVTVKDWESVESGDNENLEI